MKSWKKRLVVLTTAMSMFASPITSYAGDGDCDDDGGGFCCNWIPMVMPIPWVDWHKGTFLERQNGGGGAPLDKSVKRPHAMTTEKRLKRELKNPHDRREREYLDLGDDCDSFKARKHGATNIGLILLANVTEPHTYISARLLGKLMNSHKKQSIQTAANQQEARDVSDLKFKDILKEIKDFEENGENCKEQWPIGAVKRKTGITGLTVYTGLGFFTGDANLGAFLQGQWSKKIKKQSKYKYYTAFTREFGGGPLAKLQLWLPLSKLEKGQLHNGEQTISYTFDIRTIEGRKGLKAAINNVMFADKKVLAIKKKSDAVEVADTTGDIDGNPVDSGVSGITLVTDRKNHLKKTSMNKQAGIPFLGRARSSTHKEKLHKQVRVARNNTIKDVKAKTYSTNTAWRHLNMPFFVGYGKKWRKFPATHSHYNKYYQGIARQVTPENGSGQVGPIIRELRMQVSYSNDRIKYGSFAKKKEKIAAKIGLNTVNPDLAFDKDTNIGSAAVYYRLKLEDSDIRTLISKVNADNTLLIRTGDRMFDQYFGKAFGEYDDSFNMSRGTFKNKALYMSCVKCATHRKLKEVTRLLTELDDKYHIASKSKTSTTLAKISQAMGKNQFVLHAVLAQVATETNKLGVFTLSGEEFRKRTYVADPVNNGQEGEEIRDDSDEISEISERDENKKSTAGGKGVDDLLNTYLIEEDL